MKNHYQHLKKRLLAILERDLKVYRLQEDPEKWKEYLFTAGTNKGLTDGIDYSSMVPRLIIAYYLEDSPYYRDDSLLERAYACLCRYEEFLHEDGSPDNPISNFHDPAHAGFQMLHMFSPVELIARLTKHSAAEDQLYAKCLALMEKLGHAAATLGFHTPNHRWVISGALSVAYRHTKNPLFLNAIEEFLREGIDCDRYGEYTERSTGSYTAICNNALTTIAFWLDRPEYLEYPRRSLKLMMSFTEPDGTVNTLNSTRWDQGGLYTLQPFYCFYLLYALIDQNPEFAYIADSLLDEEKGLPASPRLQLTMPILMLHPELRERMDELQSRKPDADQSLFMPENKIVRIYRPEKDLTMTALATRTPVFFQMNYGASILQARFAGSFFGDPHANFRARIIEATENGYKLICEESQGYRARLKEAPPTSNWRQMDHSKRGMINIQTLRTEITVHFLEDGATLDIETFGCERVPTKLELSMQPGGTLFTESLVMTPQAGDYAFLREGKAEYFLDGIRAFVIEGASCKHLAGKNMHGTIPVSPKNFTLTMTDVTPQKSSVTIRVKNILND